VCVFTRECVRVRACVMEREGERERETRYMCMCVCVCVHVRYVRRAHGEEHLSRSRVCGRTHVRAHIVCISLYMYIVDKALRLTISAEGKHDE